MLAVTRKVSVSLAGAAIVALIAGYLNASQSVVTPTPQEAEQVLSAAHSVYAPDLANVAVLSTEQFGHIELTDQDGQIFQFDQHAADATLLNFMFTGCAVECPRQTAQLREIYKSVSASGSGIVKLLSISITPETDSVRTLKSFAGRFDIDSPDWRFLRASRDHTDELMSRFAISSGTDISNPLDHRNVIYLLNASGQVVQQYAADPIDTGRVSKEVSQLANPLS